MSYSITKSSGDEGINLFINLKTDYGFKRLFSNPQHLDILLHLLNALFKGVKVIKSISLRPTEIIPKNEESRKSVVDINCVGDNNETFVLEMQLAPQEFYKDRTMLYASEIIAGSVPKGEAGNNYEMNEFYIISFMNFILYPQLPDLYIHDVTLHHNLFKEPFFDKVWFKYIELCPSWMAASETPGMGVSEASLSSWASEASRASCLLCGMACMRIILYCSPAGFSAKPNSTLSMTRGVVKSK